MRAALHRLRYNLRQLFGRHPAGCAVCRATLYAWPCRSCGTWICEACRERAADEFNSLYRPASPLRPERARRS